MSGGITRRDLSKAAAGAVAFAAGMGPSSEGSAQERRLTVVSFGGAYQEAQRRQVWEPYSSETGVKIVEDSWNGDIAKIKAQLDTNNITWDIVYGDWDHAIVGCEQGWLVTVPDSVSGPRQDYFPGMYNRCTVASDVFGGVMAYDSARIPASWGGKVPTTIQDAFDTEKFPGKRGVRKRVRNFLELLLMADGVPKDQIYEELDKRNGFERFLKRARAIRNELVFYDANTQALQLLGDGEVSLVATQTGRVYAANKEGKKFVIIWDGQLLAASSLLILKGPRQEEALKLAAYHLRPEVMARLSNYFPYGPPRKSAMQYVDKEMLPHLPTSPENAKHAVVQNQEWWADHQQEIQEKFNVWLARS
jgi:putative spermidine/putrescine transport system substrate-binding protein